MHTVPRLNWDEVRGEIAWLYTIKLLVRHFTSTLTMNNYNVLRDMFLMTFFKLPEFF